MNAEKQTTTPAFQRGMTWGKQGIFRGKLTVERSEEGIVGIVVGFISANPALFQ